MLQESGNASRDALLSKQAALKFKVNEALAGVKGQLQKELEKVTKEISRRRALGLPISPALLFEQNRLFNLRNKIADEVEKASTTLAGITAAAQKSVVGQALAEAKVLRPPDTFTTDIFDFDKKAVEKLVGFAADSANTPLKAMFQRIGEPLARAVEARLIYGLATGQGNAVIARDLRQILNTTTAHALTIARTETNNAYREAARTTYRNNKAALKGYMWISALDLRTCPICWRFHGKIFPTKAKFRTHPNCRCTLVAVPKDSKEIVKTGEELFAELTAAQQRTILGSGRYELYESGAKLSDMVAYKKTPYGETPVLIRIEDVKIGKTPRPLKAKTAKPAPEPPPIAPIDETPIPTVSSFPATIAELSDVRALGGSTGARLVKDADGGLYVLKTGASADHIREEFLADQIYRALGAPVPKAKLYEEAGKTYKLAEYIEGRTLGSLSGKELAAAEAELREHFAIDALLSNRDVIGLSADNILVDRAGKVWRIDNGSSFRFRAQGGAKVYDDFLDDLWTLRDAKVNAQSAKVFGGIDYYDLGRQMSTIATPANEAKVVAMIAEADTELKAALSSRFATMRDLGQYADDLDKGEWLADYADDVSRHINGIRRAGITKRLPKELVKGDLRTAGGDPTKFYDENGYAFDSLRNRPKYGRSLLNDFEDYVNKVGGNNGLIGSWQAEQAGSSWSDASMAFKHFTATVTKPSVSENAYWKKTRIGAELAYDFKLSKMGRNGAKVYRETFAAKKAFVLEFLSNTSFYHSDRATRTIKLMRTETQEVMNIYNLTKGQRGVTVQRGLAESYSISRRFQYLGTETTVQTVSFSDVHSIYFFNRQGASYEQAAFAGNNENEVVALWRKGQTLDYIERKDSPKYGFALD